MNARDLWGLLCVTWDPRGPSALRGGPGSIALRCEMGTKIPLFAQRESSPLGQEHISEIVGHELFYQGEAMPM